MKTLDLKEIDKYYDKFKELYDGYALTVKNQTENSQVDRSEIKSLSRDSTITKSSAAWHLHVR